MPRYGNLTEFAGLPVVDFDPAASDPAAVLEGRDPAAVAWRVSSWEAEDNLDDPISPTFQAALSAFLDMPAAGETTTLVLGSWGYAAMNGSPVDVVARAAAGLPALRALFYGDITSEECEISWIKQADVTPILAACPNLEVLRVRGADGLSFPPLRHDHLVELAFESGGLPAGVVRDVSECTLPALRHLELWLGTDNYGGDADVADLAAILSGARFPALTYLGLRDSEIADQVAAALAGAGVVARLEVLDLSLGMLSDVGAAALLAGQPLTHLRRLDLHHHFLTEAMQDRLRDELLPVGVELDLSEANDADDPEERFIAVSE